MRNIPPTLNNIGLLNNHFGKFGTLVNVQVHFEGDPASALITYSEPFEAEGAMNSADAVLANRFIKVFYHHPKNVKERLGGPGNKVQMSGDTLTKTILNQEASQSTSPQNQSQEEAKSAEKAAVRNNIREMHNNLKSLYIPHSLYNLLNFFTAIEI